MKKEDLQRQIQDLTYKHPNHDEIIKDIHSFIASGLNQLQTQRASILLLIGTRTRKNYQPSCYYPPPSPPTKIEGVIAMYGFQLIEWIFKTFETKIMVLGDDSELQYSTTRELTDDLLAVCNYFVVKNNGNRACCRKQTKKKKIRRRRNRKKPKIQEKPNDNEEKKKKKIPAEKTKKIDTFISNYETKGKF